ncbi:MAG: DegV family protein [Anaerolineae bacterium]|nr:DegV family protein [Anaerolineae bacterium]
MARRVRVLTDSVADLPQAFVDRLQIKVVPGYLAFDGQTYRDDETLDRDWFYRKLSQVSARPTTAAPAPREFSEAFAGLAAEGADEIVAVVTSSTISSIYSHAQVAASSFEAVPVRVVDSAQISMGLGWAVVEAAERLAAGVPVQKVLDLLGDISERTRVLGLIDSVDYLRRSGRVGWITGGVAELLRIKPLICFQQGNAELLGRARTFSRGLQSLTSRIDAFRPLDRLSLLHSRAAPGAMAQARRELTALFPGLEIPVVDIGAVFATHVGPGCLGVALVESE